VLDTQAPAKPSNREPTAATAVSATGLPSNSASLQSVPQEMPGPVMVPTPLPAFSTVRNVRARKLGVTVTLPFSWNGQIGLVAWAPTLHGDVPVQLTKMLPTSGVAVS